MHKSIKLYSQLWVTVYGFDESYIGNAMKFKHEIEEMFAYKMHSLSCELKRSSITVSYSVGVEEYNNALYAVAICKGENLEDGETVKELKETLTTEYASFSWCAEFPIARFYEEEELEEGNVEDTVHDAYCLLWNDIEFNIMTESELKQYTCVKIHTDVKS